MGLMDLAGQLPGGGRRAGGHPTRDQESPMGLLHEIIGAILAEDGASHLDPEAGILEHPLEARTGGPAQA